jgi:hypothetical protein
VTPTSYSAMIPTCRYSKSGLPGMLSIRWNACPNRKQPDPPARIICTPQAPSRNCLTPSFTKSSTKTRASNSTLLPFAWARSDWEKSTIWFLPDWRISYAAFSNNFGLPGKKTGVDKMQVHFDKWEPHGLLPTAPQFNVVNFPFLATTDRSLNPARNLCHPKWKKRVSSERICGGVLKFTC